MPHEAAARPDAKPVLVVDRGILHRDQNFARGQIVFRDLLDLGGCLAAFGVLLDNQCVEHVCLLLPGRAVPCRLRPRRLRGPCHNPPRSVARWYRPTPHTCHPDPRRSCTSWPCEAKLSHILGANKRFWPPGPIGLRPPASSCHKYSKSDASDCAALPTMHHVTAHGPRLGQREASRLVEAGQPERADARQPLSADGDPGSEADELVDKPRPQ